MINQKEFFGVLRIRTRQIPNVANSLFTLQTAQRVLVQTIDLQAHVDDEEDVIQDI